jgi:DNA-binding NtrC family response regulator
MIAQDDLHRAAILIVDDQPVNVPWTADPDQKIAALEAGARDFLSKPFDPLEALTRIRNLLEVRLRTAHCSAFAAPSTPPPTPSS